MLSFTLYPRAIKTTIILAFLTLSVCSLNANATLTSYTSNGADLVYSSISDVTWTKDANLLGTLFATQDFNTMVNEIITASPTISDTPNPLDGNTGIYHVTASDFSINGQTSWFGAMAYVNYLNSINYGGSNQWYLPTVANTTVDYNTSTNGTTKGDELVELFYSELNGTASNNIPNTATFVNVQSSVYWSSTEYAPDTFDTWIFDTSLGYQINVYKSYQFYAWAVSPGQIAAVPEPESMALLLAGLSLVSGLVRRRYG